MKRLLLFFLVVTLVRGDHHHHEDDEDIVKDRKRACPEGFSYIGEVDVPDHLKDFWYPGDRSPTYSCYSVINGVFDWVSATHKCFKKDAQLVSVNNYREEDILFNNRSKNLFSNGEFPAKVITSGISLRSGDWEWFGAGEATNVTVENSNNNDEDTQCIEISWGEDGLTYSAVSCADQHEVAMCEVRVYTQTWYYWATTNWLSILFLITLIFFIVSACITVQMYSSRPRARAQSPGMTDMSGSPPPYSRTDNYNWQQNTTNNSGNMANTASRYAEKGREMLAKVVFYRQSNEKK